MKRLALTTAAFAALAAQAAHAETLRVFYTPVEAYQFILGAQAPNTDSLIACVYGEEGEVVRITIHHGSEEFRTFGQVDTSGRYCTGRTFDPGERGELEVEAQKFRPDGDSEGVKVR